MDETSSIILYDRERRSAYRSSAIMALQNTDVHVESALQRDSGEVSAADGVDAMKDETREGRFHKDTIDDLS